jgi:hypothetical protein
VSVIIFKMFVIIGLCPYIAVSALSNL